MMDSSPQYNLLGKESYLYVTIVASYQYSDLTNKHHLVCVINTLLVLKELAKMTPSLPLMQMNQESSL